MPANYFWLSCKIEFSILKTATEIIHTSPRELYKTLGLFQQALELLCEHAISSGGSNMTPGDALRRVFEALACGVLLPGMYQTVNELVIISFNY